MSRAPSGLELTSNDRQPSCAGLCSLVQGPDVRNYIFGHSLILHSDRANVPRWLAAFADAAGYGYGMSGQYGFADTHAQNLPPFAQWGVPGVTSI